MSKRIIFNCDQETAEYLQLLMREAELLEGLRGISRAAVIRRAIIRDGLRAKAALRTLALESAEKG